MEGNKERVITTLLILFLIIFQTVELGINYKKEVFVDRGFNLLSYKDESLIDFAKDNRPH